MRDNKKRRHSAVRLMRILYHKLHRNAIFKISHVKTLPVFMRRIKTPLRRRGIILAETKYWLTPTLQNRLRRPALFRLYGSLDCQIKNPTCLRGIRDGSPAFITWLAYSLSNPFVGFESRNISGTKIKRPQRGRLIFVAETKGFEPLIPLPVYYISNVAH